MSESSIVNDPRFPVVLLAHLLHAKRFLSRAIPKLDVNDFGRPGERPQQLIFAVVQSYHTSCGECVPAPAMAMELNARVGAAPGEYSPQELQYLNQLVGYLYSQEAVENLFSVEYMMDQLQLFLNDRRILPKAAELARANPLD